MPSYFPEGNSPLSTDSIERSMAKVVSLFPSALDTLMIDPDVASYVALSGATDVANLDAFVRGVKSLGIWQLMVCWPLRSSQNAGTGTTAYSLGGLGTFNGLLENAPTWGINGIVFNGNFQRIRLLNNIPKNNLSSAGYVGRHSSITDNQIGIRVNGLEIGNTQPVRVMAAFFSQSSQTAIVGGSTDIDGFSKDLYYAATARIANNTSIARFYNGGNKLEISNAVFGSRPLTNSFIGSRADSSLISSLYFNGNIAFAFYIDFPLSDTNVADLHALYRDTLGIGLGLP